MLDAIVQEVASRRDTNLVVSPSTGPYAYRARRGLHQKVWSARFPRLSSVLGSALREGIRRRYGLVAETEICAVLDASGFAYGEYWGPNAAERLARLSARWRRQGKRIVLLPQAFGPFRNQRLRDAFSRVLDHVDLCFARDEASLQYLQELEPRARVISSPDLTISLEGIAPAAWPAETYRVAIVPNVRITERRDAAAATSYTQLLKRIVLTLWQRGAEPFALLHDSDSDGPLIDMLNDSLPRRLSVVMERDARVLKGILGRCHAVVAGRFHALVSSLSQGVPSLATGWSHKYDELLQSFGVPDWMTDVECSDLVLLRKLDLILEESERRPRIAALKWATEQQRAKAAEMWRTVWECLAQ